MLELIPAIVEEEGYILNESPVYRAADIERRRTLASAPTDNLESPINLICMSEGLREETGVPRRTHTKGREATHHHAAST